MNFKKTTTFLMSFWLIADVSAMIPTRGSSSAGVGGATSVDISNPTIGADPVLVSNGSNADCDPTDNKGYVGLNFLRNITDGAIQSPNELKINELANGSFQIELAKHIKACTQLEFEVVKGGTNYFVRVKNNFRFTPENVRVEEGESFDNLTEDTKYYRCLEGKELLTNGGIDFQKAESQGEVSYGKLSNPFEPDVGDGSKSVGIYFGSPKATIYGTAYPAQNVDPVPAGWACVNYENFGQEKRHLYTSTRDRVYDNALRVCETESAEEIFAELSRLRASSAGNYRELERILEQAFAAAQEKRAEEIYEEMDSIEDKMRPDDEGNLPSESRAKELAERYAELSKELFKIVINPSNQEVKRLLDLREDAEGEERDRIDARIKSLNEKVAKFSKRDYDQLGFVFEAMKEYALTDEAREIEGLRLASHYFGRVYEGDPDGRYASIGDFEDAQKEIETKITAFENNRLKDWKADFATKRGSKAPIRAASREIRTMHNRMTQEYERFQSNEQRNYRNYCGSNMLGQARNPVRCRSFMAGREQRQSRMLDRRARYLGQIRTRTDQYSRYMNNYDLYLESRSQASETSDPFGFYGGSDFYTDYDIMGNATDYSSDFDWMYSMQNQQQSGMMLRSPASSQMQGMGMMQQQQGGFMMQANPYSQVMF